MYRIYVLVLLTVVYTFNFVDRQIIGILSPAIKADLGLADWQLGILKGFAFAVLYTTLGIPIARLADRANRVTIISIALALWSGFTAISGAAANFTQLALARVGVGIGEAGGSPPAHSLLSDYYPKENRAGALAFYAMGIPIGVAFAFLAGGWLTETFGWRVAFVVVGLPGILVAILLKLTVKEQPRGATDAVGVTDNFKEMQINGPAGPVERAIKFFSGFFPGSWKEAIFRETAIIWRAAKHLLSIPTYRAVVIACAAVSFTAYAQSTWVVDFYVRSHAEFPRMSIYFWLGIISGTAYAGGTFLGGYIVDKLAIRNRRVYGYIPAAALAINLPCYLAALWVGSPELSLALMVPVNIALGIYLGPCFALAQTLAPTSVRALSTAVFFFVLNMIALGFGPTTAGFLSSIFTGFLTEERALRWALTIVAMVTLYAIYMFIEVGRRVETDWSKAAGEAP